jgi:hypothetical protein
MGSSEILANEIPDRRKCDLCHRLMSAVLTIEYRHIPPYCEEGHDDFVEPGSQY